ncbi:MAG: hypothetical protein ACJ74O_13940 [Frankiaceae bacterium]
MKPHDLRASHATWIIDSGRTVMDAAARLGHNVASVTTRHYARTVSGRDQDIAESMDATARAATETAAKRAAEAASGVARA